MNFSADDERRRRFASHQVDEVQEAAMGELKIAFLALSERVAQLVPPGREQALTLTKMEEACFYGVAGIARNPR